MRWKKFLETTITFLFAYVIFLLFITNALTRPSIPISEYFTVGIIISVIVTLLYILPVSFQSYVYTAKNIKHTLSCNGTLSIIEEIPSHHIKYSIVKYSYYMTISVLGIVAYTYFSGLQILIANSAIGLGSFFALVELMPTSSNGTKQFSLKYKKTYLVLLVFSGTLFLISLQHFWF